MVFEKIRDIIADKMEIDADKITMESSLQDLEIDSLDMVDIIMSIEEDFDVSLEDLTDVKTIKDVVDHVAAKKA